MKIILLILHSYLVVSSVLNVISHLQDANKAGLISWMISTLCWLILVIWDVCNIAK
jgi:hypothetical protein